MTDIPISAQNCSVPPVAVREPLITQALYKLALELGVKFEFGAKVSKIVVEGKKAVGILIYPIRGGLPREVK